MANNKLELTWLDKDKPIKVEPRLLIENPKLSNIPVNPTKENGIICANLLIHGDNLIALKSLESKYAGKIKCIYIDPPIILAQLSVRMMIIGNIAIGYL